MAEDNTLWQSGTSGIYQLTDSASHYTVEDEDEEERYNNNSPAGREKEREVYTVEDAIEHMGFGPFQLLVTLFSGMIWISDAMEVMLLSVLSPIVTCDWLLEDWEEALITSVVFIGFFFGGLFWGAITDMIGRKRVLLIVSILIVIFGLASAAAPKYWTLLLFRCLAGFFIAGTDQSITYYTEFLPKKFRGFCLVLLDVWWALGTMLAALFALAIIPNVPDPISGISLDYEHINWRIYVAACTIPTGLVIVFFPCVPESARFYITKGDNKKGEEVVALIARINRKTVPPGRLVSQEEKEQILREREERNTDNNTEQSLTGDGERGDDDDTSPQAPLIATLDSLSVRQVNRIETSGQYSRISQIKVKLIQSSIGMCKDLSLLFTGGTWKTTLILIALWMGGAWLYYGAILLTTTILETGYDPHCGKFNESIDTGCQNLTSSFYLQIVWTSAAEFPGIIITLITIEIIGRKITMAIEFFAAAVFLGLLYICVPDIWLTVFLFCGRAFIAGVYQTVYIYTPEVYPTKVRGVALGAMTSVARLGALVTPFVAQALFHVSDYATISLYVGTALLFAVLSLLLPIETKGKELRDLKSH